MDLYNLYVIYYWMEWVGSSLDSDTLYATKEEAEAKVVELQKTEQAIKNKITYRVVTLYDWIQQAKEEAVDAYKYSEANSPY